MMQVSHALFAPLVFIASLAANSGAAAEPTAFNPVLHLGRPSAVCIYSEVEQPVIEALAQRNDPALRSIKEKNLNSSIHQVIYGSFVKAKLPLYDSRGSPFIRSFEGMRAALQACQALSNGIFAYVRVSLLDDAKPYKLTAVIAKGKHMRSMTFARDALAVLEAYDRTLGPTPGSKAPAFLRPGPALSVDSDVEQLFMKLLGQVDWNEP